MAKTRCISLNPKPPEFQPESSFQTRPENHFSNVPSKDSPAGSDGLPTALIESMAREIPVIATRKAGIPDLVKDGENGLLAEPNAPDSLAERLGLLLQDKELQHRLCLAGRKLIEREFDLHHSVSHLVRLIQGERLIESPRFDNGESLLIAVDE